VLFVLVLLTFHCLSLPAVAQSATATLSGTVEDEQGAVVPSATVTIINNATLLKRDAITNGEGSFTVPLLQPGTYTVRAQHDGFRIAQIDNLVLNVGDQKALRIPLQTGDVKETVNITGEAPLISESPAVGTVVDRQFAANIPLNGRSFQSLINLTPGIVTVPASTNANTAGQFSVNGQRASANNFSVDGVSANFGAGIGVGPQTEGNLPGLTAFGTTQSLVSVDALEEFKVLTSTYAAEYGRQPGGQISIITRSGTNSFHGSVFDYVRNDVFDANDWFANANRSGKAPERQNDFGGTFSGPIFFPIFGDGGPGWYNGRNRTFFFFSYEGLRLRLPQFALTNVPSLALRQQAPAAMQPILNAFPLPNGRELFIACAPGPTEPECSPQTLMKPNGLAEFGSTYTDSSSLDATSIRIDHTFGNKLAVFGKYNYAPSNIFIRRSERNLSLSDVLKLSPHTITLGVTESLTSGISNEFRVNYNSTPAYRAFQLDNFGGAVPPPRGALIPSQYDSPGSSVRGAVDFVFSGRTATGSTNVDLFDRFDSTQRQFNIVDNLSYVLGSHQLKFGVDYRRTAPISSANQYLSSVRFTSKDQVLLARAATGSVSTSIEIRPVFGNFSAYGQDTWRRSRRLTLEFGIRWEINPPPTEENGYIPLAVTQIDDLATMKLAPVGTQSWKTTYNNLAPRLGIAYLLRQRPGRETVVRGGFGVFYDTGNDFAGFYSNVFPYSSTKQLTNVVFPFSASQVAPSPLPIQNGLTQPYPLFRPFDPDLKLPYTLQWSAAVEQSLGKSQAITISYVGAAGRRLLQQTQIALSSTTVHINPSFTTIQLTTNSATSDYDALQAQFQRRLSRGLQLLASYTWSHALDDDSTSITARAARRGNADFDVRHILSAAATYDIPKLTRNPFMKAFFGGWSIDGSIHAQSALPVDLIATTFTDLTTGNLINVRPNVIPDVPFYMFGDQYPGGRTLNSTIPTAAQIASAGCSVTGAAKGAFCTPLAGQSGNLGRNQVRGLPAWQVDMALRREFRLGERLKVQLRGEAFNILNHPNFGATQTSLSANNFGQATNMLNRQLGGISQLYQIGGPRSLQFALKLLF
jgi:hypothetical protein